MEVRKKFAFSGIFRKLHEEDAQPVEIFNASIYCYTNGSIIIEIDSEISQQINNKRFLESTPIHQYKDSTIDPMDISSLLWMCTNQSETEIIQEAYEGDYEIEGKTLEGSTIKATIADPNFIISFQSHNTEIIDEEKKHRIRLRDLYIDYNPDLLGDGKTEEIVYGLANIEIMCDVSSKIGNLDAEIDIKRGNFSSIDGNPSAEMILRGIYKNERDSYETYFSWFKSLLSFASGHNVNQIYKIETIQYEKAIKKIEYWSGNESSNKVRGLSIIQTSDLHLFIQKCSKEVTWESFSDKGVGLALIWYIDTFASTDTAVNFLLLCTVLECLNNKCSKNILENTSKRLIPRALYRKINRKIKEILVSFKSEFDNERDIEKYNIFISKVEKFFEEARCNQLGSLRTSLKEMFKIYKVPYEDLFPELEFIKIRDSIVHEGFGGLDVAVELHKLSNLIVRVFLAILLYDGNYMEHRKIEISSKFRQRKYGLICRYFPFVIAEKLSN